MTPEQLQTLQMLLANTSQGVGVSPDYAPNMRGNVYEQQAANMEQQALEPQVQPQGFKENAVSGIRAFIEGMANPDNPFAGQQRREQIHLAGQQSKLQRAKELRQMAMQQQELGAKNVERQEDMDYRNRSLDETKRLREVQEFNSRKPEVTRSQPGEVLGITDPTTGQTRFETAPGQKPVDPNLMHRDRVQGENIIRDYFDESDPSKVTHSADLGKIRSLVDDGQGYGGGKVTVQYTGPDGKLTVGVLDKASNTVTPARLAGQAPGDNTPIAPLPTSEQRNQAASMSKAMPILNKVSELADLINTGEGLMAKAQGEAQKLAAKANYDDDVAEYQALVMSFVPRVARAMGHVGVLTQQDIDASMAMFPKPGDSKTLKDRKLKTLVGLLSEVNEIGISENATRGAQPAQPAGQPQGGGLIKPGGALEALINRK